MSIGLIHSNSMRLFLALGIVLVILALYQTGILNDINPDSIRANIEAAGSLGPLLFILVYCVATVLFIPGTPFTLLGGVLFGVVFGSLYVIIGATIGAMLAFLLARFVGGRWLTLVPGAVGERLRMYDDRLVSHGFMTVLLLRLVPLFPFNGLNVALGLTQVKLQHYALATGLGIIPGTVAYVYFGNAIATVSPREIVIAVLGILLLIVAGRLLSKRLSSV